MHIKDLASKSLWCYFSRTDINLKNINYENLKSVIESFMWSAQSADTNLRKLDDQLYIYIYISGDIKLEKYNYEH